MVRVALFRLLAVIQTRISDKKGCSSACSPNHEAGPRIIGRPRKPFPCCGGPNRRFHRPNRLVQLRGDPSRHFRRRPPRPARQIRPSVRRLGMIPGDSGRCCSGPNAGPASMGAPRMPRVHLPKYMQLPSPQLPAPIDVCVSSVAHPPCWPKSSRPGHREFMI